ncbi:MAG TPA: TonB-dependent receptor [Planctomycetota bacterium]|nr:TonB-dependent receptor [Planctomycetota bacterium]
MTARGLVAIAVLAWCGTGLPAALAEQAGKAEEERKATEEQPKEERVVVTATRLETPYEQVGSSLTVITRQEIERRKQTTVLDLLRGVPGLDVTQAGPAGSTASVFIRGAKSEHTLVLMDGVEMNDPMTPGRSFDWAHLTTDNVERIEVLRGPQSTLYGSDAIGGVINIITRKGKGRPSVTLTSEVGSHHTFRESLSALGATPVFNYAVSASRFDTDGVSQAARWYGNREDDGYRNCTFATKLGFTPAENFEVDVITRCVDARADLDNFEGVLGDDPNYTTDVRQHFVRAQGRLKLFDGRWEQKFGVSYSNLDRTFRNDTDLAHPFDLERRSYRGRTLKFDWQHNLRLHETNTVTLGLETEEERGQSMSYWEYFDWWTMAPGSSSSPFSERSARMNSVYVQDQISLWDRWFTTIGARLDDHSAFGSQTTYRVASIYHIRATGTRIKGSHGTGFKVPTLFQLYAGKYGNATLQPEESKGCDIGIEQDLFGGRLTLGATCFRNEVKNLIDMRFDTWQYYNTGLDAHGVELTATARPLDNLTITASYTHTRSTETVTKEPFVRRPRDKASLNVNYRPIPKLNLNLGVHYVGPREDFLFDNVNWGPTTRVTLHRYVLVNAAASYDVTSNLQVFGRVENLLDQRYEEVKGYGTLGIGFFTGVKASF